MAGSAASESIIFIGAVIAATAFAGVLSGVGNALSQDVRAQGQTAAEELASDIRIINDPADMPSPLVVYVKNTGSTSLLASDTHVVVDGVISESTTFDVLGSSDNSTWTAGSVLEITVNDIAPGTGDHRVKVVAGRGVSAELAWSA